MRYFQKIQQHMYADSQHIYAEYLVLQALLFRDQCYFHYASQASDSLKIVGKKSYYCQTAPAPWETFATVTS